MRNLQELQFAGATSKKRCFKAWIPSVTFNLNESDILKLCFFRDAHVYYPELFDYNHGMSQPLLYSIIDKAVFDYSLIEKGDRILVGASGGKDSTALIEYFSERMKRKGAGFTFKALAIQSDFAPPFPEKIISLFKKWNVDFEIMDVDITGRLKENRKMNCYWCSTQRRKELLHYAMDHGFNKIALGHHLDDILETLIMNMTEKQKLTAMPPSLAFDNYPITVIRPLCYVPEKTIIEHGEKMNYLGYTCTCSYQENSARKTARKKLEILSDGDSKTKQRILESLRHIDPKYLP